MFVSGARVVAHFRQQAEKLEAEVEGHRQLGDEISAGTTKVTEQVAGARRDLAAVYLPDLTEPSIERVARLTGFQGFARRDPRSALAHERRVLELALTRLESDARYADREPALARLSDELASARDTLAPLAAACERFELQVGFLELVEIGYDTPRFAEKWWQSSYWKHWADGDRICKELGMGDFGDDVLPAYAKVSEPRNYMRDEVRRIEGQIDAIHEHVRERDRVADRLANLETSFLDESRAFLGEHLELADAALLEQWAEPEAELLPAVTIGLRKLAGLRAKRVFLADLGAGVGDLTTQLVERGRKARQKQAKFQRPRHHEEQFAETTIAGTIDEKMQALAQQRDKVTRRVRALVASERYAGFELGQDQELWWLYLVQAPPPRLAPTLYDYYQRHPGATPLTDPDHVELGPAPGEAAAVAYAAGELEQGGAYLS